MEEDTFHKKIKYLGIKFVLLQNVISFYLILTQFGCSGGITGVVTDTSTLTKPIPCLKNTVSSQPCVINQSNVIVTNTLGDNINLWSNDQSKNKLITNIPSGYYSDKKIIFEDANLISTNIKSGLNIFGVSGTFNSVLANCKDDQLNTQLCSTLGNRYISSTFGTNISVSNGMFAPITKGFYDGTQSCNISDENLIAGNIKTGTTILGISGTLITPYSSCANNNFNSQLCSTDSSIYVTANKGSAISNWTNSNSGSTVSGALSQGFYTENTPITFNDPALVASNIKLGVTLFNIKGSYFGTSGMPLLSNAHHDKTLNPIFQIEESVSYAGATFPSNYRDVPLIASDTTEFVSGQTWVKRSGSEWNTGVPRKVCGKGINTSLVSKIADCASQHILKPNWDAGVVDRMSWDGAINGNAGQGSWTLVTVYSSALANGSPCDSSCKEVWRDDRTGLIWSDLIAKFTNWCLASGNADSDDPQNFCNSLSYQSNYPTAQSLCAEVGLGTITQVQWSGENWSSAIYDPSKGAMGRKTSISVRWRLPTKYDFEAADNNGLKFVVPFFNSFYIWTSTTSNGGSPILFYPFEDTFIFDFNPDVDLTSPIRDGYDVVCVGR